MRVLSYAAALAAIFFVGSANAATLTLIDYTSGAASVGNGALFSDPTGVAATAAVGVNVGASVDSANANGRALDTSGPDSPADPLDLATITDNQGIQIDGFTSFRGAYSSANSGFGFLENGGRLGKPNADFDGQGFANSNQFYLLSDSYSTAGFTSVSWEFLAGSDNGATDVETYLYVDGVGSLVDTSAALGSAGTVISGTEIISGSSVQLLVQLTAPSGQRSLIDDVRLTAELAIPEPGTIALSMLAFVGLGAVGMRSRLG